MQSEPHQPDQDKPKKVKKLPLGTKKSPWYKVPEHYENGVLIPARYYRYSNGGVWISDTVPEGSCVKSDTTY